MSPAKPCRSCAQLVRWGETVDGAKMPLDVHPSPLGNVYALPDGRLRVLTDAEAERGRAAGAVLYRSHFASCPAAAAHRGVARDQMALEL